MKMEVGRGGPNKGAPSWDAQFEDAYRRHFHDLRRLARRLMDSPEAADDLVQETFVRAASSLATVPEPAQGPYLRRTLLNIWKNWIRRWQLERATRARLDSSDGRTSEVDDDVRVVWDAVRVLPTKQRIAILLRYSLDLSERDVAASMGCSVGTVKKHTHRAMERLRKELRDVS